MSDIFASIVAYLFVFILNPVLCATGKPARLVLYIDHYIIIIVMSSGASSISIADACTVLASGANEKSDRACIGMTKQMRSVLGTSSHNSV